MGRKHYTSQNVLAAVDFDLKFTYVLAGWEGSVHDANILTDSMSQPDGINIPDGKSTLEMLAMHVGRVFFHPSGKPGTISTSSLVGTILGFHRSCLISDTPALE